MIISVINSTKKMSANDMAQQKQQQFSNFQQDVKSRLDGIE